MENTYYLFKSYYLLAEVGKGACAWRLWRLHPGRTTVFMGEGARRQIRRNGREGEGGPLGRRQEISAHMEKSIKGGL